MATSHSLEARRAVERVTSDSSLAFDVATELARALQLPGTNKTLGRKFVGFGLSALRDGASESEVEALFVKKTRNLASTARATRAREMAFAVP